MRTNNAQPINKQRLTNHAVVEMIDDLVATYYTHPEDRITIGGWVDWLNECGAGYDISAEDLEGFGYKRALELYANKLEHKGEIASWTWNANYNIMYLRQYES